MARHINIFFLLKNLEAFVKSVPIDPKSRKYKEWVKCRAEMKKAIKGMDKMLRTVKSLEDIEKGLPPLLVPCRGQVPLKQVLDAVLLPCRNVPAKSAALSHCGRPGPLQVP
jgi:hypothetical protein